MPLHIELRELRGISILDLDGSLVLGDENSVFRQSIDELIERGGKNILLNLRNVNRIDSSGLGNLVSAYSQVQKAGGVLKLVGTNSHYVDLLVLTKLITLFPNFDDEQDAIRSFSPDGSGDTGFDILEFVRSEEREQERVAADDKPVQQGES
jgi:anti-sigma B factor antagonist